MAKRVALIPRSLFEEPHLDASRFSAETPEHLDSPDLSRISAADLPALSEEATDALHEFQLHAEAEISSVARLPRLHSMRKTFAQMPRVRTKQTIEALVVQQVHEHDHIVLCCGDNPSSVRRFMAPLRSGLLRDPPHVVVLTEHTADARWGDLTAISHLQIVRGSMMISADLLRAGVNHAKRVVILSPLLFLPDGSDDSESCDAQVLLAGTFFMVSDACVWF
jgi:hypothetical protein